jgi:hypothetical protein
MMTTFRFVVSVGSSELPVAGGTVAVISIQV